MLNLLVLKLIKHLTAKSKGLRWGTEYTYFPQGPIISCPGQWGVKDFGG